MQPACCFAAVGPSGNQPKTFSSAWLLTLLMWLLQLAAPASCAAVAANKTGLFRHYYNSGFSSTPITSMPTWSDLTAANITFDTNTTGNFGDPQLSSNDTFCGGYYHGALHVISAGTYILQVQSKNGFALIVDNSTILSSNSTFRLFTLQVCQSAGCQSSGSFVNAIAGSATDSLCISLTATYHTLQRKSCSHTLPSFLPVSFNVLC